MSLPSIHAATLSRPPSIAATAAAVTGTGAAPARSHPGFRYRLGLSQPLDSPNYLRLKEMAGNIRADTKGRLAIDVHGAGDLGSHRVMLAMVQDGPLEMD